jgi:trk system potassium uptake protein TrkH
VIHLRPIVFALGFMLCVMAALMVLPAVVAIADGLDDWQVFIGASVFTFFVGGLLLLVGHETSTSRIGVREGFLLTTVCWVVVTAFAAIPFIGLGLPYTDAYFESMSGLTTTGSTILVGLDNLPRSILLWRALLTGVGGLGMIVVAVLILPYLRVGGMQLFHTENSDRSEKVMPRATELLAAMFGIYIVFIFLCGSLYIFFGMSVFDAICHALTTVATGGFSTKDASIGHFKSAAIEWVCIVFMILGALPFVIYIRMKDGNFRSLVHDQQVRGFLIFLAVLVLIMSMWLSSALNLPFAEAFRRAAFNLVSIATTTGYASEDYTKWGALAVGVFFLLTFVGGCSGSTTGSIKIYRFQIAALLSRSHFQQLISPNRVVTLTYNGRRLPEDVPFSIVAFFAMYFGTVGVFTVILAALGLDLVTALSAAATAVCNVGPGLGEIVGPAGSFAPLPAAAKWVLSFAMLLGRLELFTVLVLLRPEFWRS